MLCPNCPSLSLSGEGGANKSQSGEILTLGDEALEYRPDADLQCAIAIAAAHVESGDAKRRQRKAPADVR